MKLRTSFFNGPTFKKDITRFLPLWALYTVAMLLIMLSTVSNTFATHPVRLLNSSLSGLAFANLIYAALTAQLLFGDLFQSRLCNALHAMPVTRTARFGSHIAAGFLFSFVPNLLVSLLMMPQLNGFWYISLLWLSVMTLQYLFFFAAGVLSVMCTGSRFAMVVVYCMVNFLGVVICWFADMVFIPMMPGVVLNAEPFLFISPFASFVRSGDYIRFDFSFSSYDYGSAAFYSRTYINEVFRGFGEDWLYLFISAAAGIALLAAALVLYRRRKLESAGDFIVVKWLSPIFLVLYTLCAGAFLSIFGQLFTYGGDLVFLIAGLVIGFFTGKMLLERTIRVFRGKNFGQLAILAVAMVLAVFVISTDLLGIVSYVPDAEDVDYVVYDGWNAYEVKLTESDHIETVCQIHKLALNDYCDNSCENGHSYFYVEYHMKDGRVVLRQYYLCDFEARVLLETLPKSRK